MSGALAGAGDGRIAGRARTATGCGRGPASGTAIRRSALPGGWLRHARSGMRALRSHGVEIDLCARCHGVWLDAGELEQLLALNQPQEDSAADEVLEGAIDFALEFGDVALGRRDISCMPRGRSIGATTSDPGLILVEIESPSDSRMRLPERPDPTPLVEAGAGMLDSAGEAIGAVFEFVGDALSGL